MKLLFASVFKRMPAHSKRKEGDKVYITDDLENFSDDSNEE